jgi:hypothetical protein
MPVVRFRDLFGRTELIDVDAGARISDLAPVVGARFGLPADAVHLIQDGRELAGAALVGGLRPESFVLVVSAPGRPQSPAVIRPRGQSGPPEAPPHQGRANGDVTDVDLLRTWLRTDSRRFAAVLQHIGASKPRLASAIGRDPLPFLHQIGLRATFRDRVLTIMG